MAFQISLLSILGRLCILFAVYKICNAIYTIYLHPLSKFPGPKAYAASSLPLTITTGKGLLHSKIKELHEQYGDVVRIAPDELSICSAAAFQEVLNRPGLPKNRKVYNTPRNGSDSIFTAHSNADHGRQRRLLSHAFSEKALRDQEPLIKTYVDLLMIRLHENSDKPQDMVAWFNYVAFDIVGDLTLGESFNCLRDSRLHPWVAMLFTFFKGSLYRSLLIQIPGFKKIMPFILPKKIMKQAMDHIKYTRDMVMVRLERETDRPDFMSNIMKHNEKDTGMTTDEIVSTSGFLLLAGSETTATLLAAVTYFLLMNQEVLAKLVVEIRTTFKTEEEINMVSVNALKYQLAVLDETMRLHPPAPLGSFRMTPPEGASVGGIWVPGNTAITSPIFAGHRRKTNWRDADSFIPERWLGDPKYNSDNRGMFIPFSIGTRNCIGRNLATAEMRVIIARLLWNFDLALQEQSRTWIDMKVYNLWEKRPLMVKLTQAIRN